MRFPLDIHNRGHYGARNGDHAAQKSKEKRRCSSLLKLKLVFSHLSFPFVNWDEPALSGKRCFPAAANFSRI
jgi:hypothetical protein